MIRSVQLTVRLDVDGPLSVIFFAPSPRMDRIVALEEINEGYLHVFGIIVISDDLSVKESGPENYVPNTFKGVHFMSTGQSSLPM